MSKIIRFDTPQHKSRIKLIAANWGDQPQTIKQAAEKIGIPFRLLYCYLAHLRESGSLVEVSRSGKGCRETVLYRHSGIYLPISDDLDDIPVRRVASGVKPFRDDLFRAFFGDARISG